MDGQENSFGIDDEPISLPITYDVIYHALSSIFPDHVTLIMSSIRRIVVINQDSAHFSTMGITASGTLFISRKFWDEHMQDYNALRTVLFHELHHCIGGDVYNINTDKTEEAKLENLANLYAMDARINAFAVISRPEIQPEEFLSKFYNEEVQQKDSLAKILTPSAVFTDSAEDSLLKPFHEKFYNSEEFCSHHDLAQVILDILKNRPKDNKGTAVILLGSHGDSGEEISEEELDQYEHVIVIDNRDKQEDEGPDDTYGQADLPERVKQAVKDHVAQVSARGVGKASTIAKHIVELSNDITEKLDISKFKKFMFDNIFHNVRAQATVKEGKYTSSPIIPRRISVTDMIMTAAGYPPLLWKSHKNISKFNPMLLPIYLDVSGSTWSYLPKIIKLICNISNEIDYVWGFSNKVVKHSLEDLENGRIDSTGGTDFDCIVEHAIENNFKHIVVMTDGYAYYSKAYDAKVDQILSVATILFGYPDKNNYFSRVYNNSHDIDEVTI